MNEIMDSVLAALDSKKLNFDAELKPVSALLSANEETGEPQWLNTSLYAPVRTDTNTIIANRTFTKKYHPIQNRDAFKIISDISQLADIKFQNVGSWGNGAGVFAQIALGENMEIGTNGDEVGRYLSVINSHDGSRAMSILITPYRFWCKNQLSKAIAGATRKGSIMRVKHTADASDRMKELAQTISVCDDVFKRTEEEYKRLADTTVSMEQVREAMARMMPYKHDVDMDAPSRHWEKMVTGMIHRFENADNGRVEQMTGWNLYNAIQGTLQHDAKNTATKEYSVLMGSIANQSTIALRQVEDIVFNPASYNRTNHAEFDKLFRHVAA